MANNKSNTFVGGVVGAAIGAAGVAAAVALSKKENRDKVKRAFNQAKSRVSLEAKKFQTKVKPVVKDVKKKISNIKNQTGPNERKTLPSSPRK
ncbi:MAG: hypothetical protein WCT01_02175 [Candidatus Shapirobacteria bacterium]|jgi:gas vesicle protein